MRRSRPGLNALRRESGHRRGPGRAGLPAIPQIKAWNGQRSKDDFDSWYKNHHRSAVVENGALVIEDSMDVRTEYFQKVSVAVNYWLDKNDDQAMARLQLEESD